MNKKQEHDRITQLVQEERDRIRGKHGVWIKGRKLHVQNLPPEEYLSILVEEVGEVAQALNDWRWSGGSIDRVREKLVQVGAVAADMRDRITRMLPEETKSYVASTNDDVRCTRLGKKRQNPFVLLASVSSNVGFVSADIHAYCTPRSGDFRNLTLIGAYRYLTSVTQAVFEMLTGLIDRPDLKQTEVAK